MGPDALVSHWAEGPWRAWSARVGVGWDHAGTELGPESGRDVGQRELAGTVKHTLVTGLVSWCQRGLAGTVKHTLVTKSVSWGVLVPSAYAIDGVGQRGLAGTVKHTLVTGLVS